MEKREGTLDAPRKDLSEIFNYNNEVTGNNGGG